VYIIRENKMCIQHSSSWFIIICVLKTMINSNERPFDSFCLKDIWQSVVLFFKNQFRILETAVKTTHILDPESRLCSHEVFGEELQNLRRIYFSQELGLGRAVKFSFLNSMPTFLRVISRHSVYFYCSPPVYL
jgi:hypothetical protein